jgi:hypothetical protein
MMLTLVQPLIQEMKGRILDAVRTRAGFQWPPEGVAMTFDELTQATIGGAFKVGNLLGCGFLEKVYENALALELRGRGLGRFAATRDPGELQG